MLLTQDDMLVIFQTGHKFISLQINIFRFYLYKILIFKCFFISLLIKLTFLFHHKPIFRKIYLQIAINSKFSYFIVNPTNLKFYKNLKRHNHDHHFI